MKDVPVTYSLPPAVEVPLNDQGVQEVTLVVLPEGYNPAHFSVKKGLPVHLIFRQLGQVGCGDELIFTWGKGKSADLKLPLPLISKNWSLHRKKAVIFNSTARTTSTSAP